MLFQHIKFVSLRFGPGLGPLMPLVRATFHGFRGPVPKGYKGQLPAL